MCMCMIVYYDTICLRACKPLPAIVQSHSNTLKQLTPTTYLPDNQPERKDVCLGTRLSIGGGKCGEDLGGGRKIGSMRA